ncbi:DUF1593 domain-containing protein [Dyadobacter bucti]|uniref:DUF1593 domain-containing protein n=1 Tax=Dyadobacter bucti TaxID=2572203 RepID=UPI001109F2D6|nr:DUF1593 domain-containing protein [Dyadobacter bucti]
MKAKNIFILLFLFQHSLFAQDKPGSLPSEPDQIPVKSRVFVLTDISNEPDDEESMVRFLVYANQFDVEGLVATTSMYLKNETREDLIRRQIAAYGEVRKNLSIHEPGFPEKEQLLEVTASGQPGFGMSAVGKGKATAGSRLLEKALTKQDGRPLWVCAWGGVNTLAQALSDLKDSNSEAAFSKITSRIRLYAITDQDDAGVWLRKEFPALFYIVSPAIDHHEYYKGTWTGISGDKRYGNAPYYKFELVENAWLKKHVIKNHGPLGALYPPHLYIMEGDTPSFLGLINNGLGWAASPSYGGWGGRYSLYRSYAETRPIWTNNEHSRDKVTLENGRIEISDPATIWRWREHYQNDFAARMDWCVTGVFSKANHNPVAVLNKDQSKEVIRITAKSGETVTLSADGSKDPDNNKIDMNWLVYKEAGTYDGEINLSSTSGKTVTFTAPQVKKPASIHIVLQLKDDGVPSLVSYRRAVIQVAP